ncbi:MAG: cold shock domain-containing protein [Planctomycetota bacterium]|nr:cold shock domain-containing protein [Planctomycetota bacterium]
MRIGKVVKVIADKKIGFIRSAGLHDDVFFHFSVVEKIGTADLQDEEEVEFEIDELAHIEKTNLKATLVRRSSRQLEVKLRPSDAPSFRAQHHPKARKRRPTWRGNKSSGDETTEDE